MQNKIFHALAFIFISNTLRNTFAGEKFGNITLSAPTPQNGQTQSNNSSAIAEELFECVWPFCGVGV